VKYSITNDAALINDDTEAIRNLFIAMSLLTAVVGEVITENDLDVSSETANALHLIEQANGAVSMYLERHGKWPLRH
jgi:selenophosphate synthetase-related protein